MGTVLCLPFADQSFEAVPCKSMLHHLSDVGQGLRELHRVLKPSGVLVVCNEHIISVFSDGTKFQKHHPATAYGVQERSYPTWWYRKELRKAGFRSVNYFQCPPAFNEFITLTHNQNPLRGSFMGLPVIGPGLGRFFYMAHLPMRAHVLVPETQQPVISIAGYKSPRCLR